MQQQQQRHLHNTHPQQQQNNNNEQSQNPNQPAQPQKKRKKPFALKPQHFQNQKGLQKLYQLTNQINWNDPMTIQSAMNLYTVTLKTWHNQFAPKYSYDYFLQRCQVLGNHKITSAYLNKVRRIHKGVEKWDNEIGGGQGSTPNELRNTLNIQQKQNDNNKEDDKKSIKSYNKAEEDKQNLMQRFKIAEQLGKQHIQQMDNLNINHQVDQMMEEDLRLFEEMSKKKKLWAQKQQEQEGIDLGGEDQGVQFQPSDYQ